MRHDIPCMSFYDNAYPNSHSLLVYFVMMSHLQSQSQADGPPQATPRHDYPLSP